MNGEITSGAILGMIIMMVMVYSVPVIVAESIARNAGRTGNGVDQPWYSMERITRHPWSKPRPTPPQPQPQSHTGSSTDPQRSTRLRSLRLITFLLALVVSGVWIVYVMVIDGRGDFSHAQVVGASVNGTLLIAGLTVLALRWELPKTTVIPLVTVYSSLAAGLAFALVAFTDDTGLWGVGLMILAVLSLLGFGFVSSATAAIFSAISRKPKSPHH